MQSAAPSALDKIGWIDLEFSRTEKLLAIGALFAGHKLHIADLKSEASRRQALERIAAFLGPARYIGGHNLIAFDLPRIAQLAPGSPLLRLPVVDTLPLSALAFPGKPYHRLVKDYKLVHDAINDPVRDCELALMVANESLQQLGEQPEDWKGLLAEILSSSSQYIGLASLIRECFTPNSTADSAAPSSIRALLTGRVCPTSFDRILRDECIDVSWAFLLAWLRVAGTGSALPMWVMRQWPTLHAKAGALRGRPCRDPACTFCSTQHDPARYLRRFRIQSGFREEPRTADGAGSLQEAIVRAVYRGESVLAILPTGGGKSLCYQLPALARYEATGELTVIISPLQSLMKDQVDGVEASLGGRLAEAVSGMLSPVERKVAFDRVARGETAMLYLSPEQLRNPSVMSLLATRRIGCWVYDEAHCISKWGHDFRPDYIFAARSIAKIALQERQSGADDDHSPQVCAMTATAKPDVKFEVTEHLRDELGIALSEFDGGANRDNLAYEVRRVSEHAKCPEVLDLIRSHASDGAAVVFAASRRRTEEMAGYLREHEIVAEFYHAGIENDAKKDVQNRFLRNEIRVICATNAFGMGVDKPDIRLVVHLDVPGSLENYLQEAGRAGRDRLPAACVLLFTDDDLDRQFQLGAYSALSKREMQEVLRALRRIARRARDGEGAEFFVTAGEILAEDVQLEEEAGSNKVRTAVAWLERRKFISRNMNRNTVWAGKPRVQNLEEARQKIDSLGLHPSARAQWLGLMERLLADGTGEPVSSDELMGCLPAAPDGHRDAPGKLMRLLRDMEQKGLLEQAAIYTLFIDAEVEHDSSWRLKVVERTQEAFSSWMQAQDPDAPLSQALALDLNAAVSAIRASLRPTQGEDAAASITARILDSVLECLARDGLAWGDGAHGLSKRYTGHNAMEIALRFDLPSLQAMGERRIALSSAILAHARQQLKASGVKGKNCRVELTLAELKGLIAKDLFLSAQIRDEDAAIESAMYALDKLGIASVRGGRTVIRQAMGLRLEASAKSRRVNARDMAELEAHYGEKRVQIHIIGLFARLGAKRIGAAMRLALDYFRLPREEFLSRYRAGLGDELDTPAAPGVVDEIVASLNDPDQQAIVTSDVDSNLLVLAGPGSGKTRTLVHRIAYLVRIRRVPPWRIFVLTFNRLAAELIRRKLRELIGSRSAGQVRVHTYHALALRVLGVSLDAQALNDPESKVTLDELVPLATRVIEGEQTILGIDADQAHEQLLGRVSHLLVDEYQDINNDQYDLVSAITKRVAIEEDVRPSIFVVGDDDQNIYAWNGTSTEFIRRFENEYAAERRILSSNYRSTRYIIELSQRLIAHNEDRMKRGVALTVDAARANDSAGAPVRIVSVAADQNEVGVLLGQLKTWQRTGVALEQVAVLARQNQELHALRHACELEGIPVRGFMPGMGALRLIQVRECARYLKHLAAMGHETIARQRALDVISESRSRSEWLRWDVLLYRLVEAYWTGVGPEQGVPASDLRRSLVEALHLAGREFTYGQGVFLATVHASKGQEFDRVVVPAAGWRRRGDRDAREEERRLLYVGMTRARHELVVHSSSSHPFDAELEGPAIERSNGVAIATPIRVGSTMYEMLGLEHVHLGYAGRYDSEHPIHAALAGAGAGDDVQLHSEREGVGIYFHDVCIGRLSKRAAEVWLPRLDQVDKVTVDALVMRKQEYETLAPERVRVPEWEVPVLEVRWIP